MNVLYIAPRYHTNQTSIMKGWIENGDNVKFISQYEGKIENHILLKPEILGYSKIFLVINKLYTIFKKNEIKNSANTVAFKVKFGFPPLFKLAKQIVVFKPDIVILRERSIYSIIAYFICKINKYKVILYNQTPLWELQNKSRIKNFISKLISPNIRITPVYGKKTEKAFKEENAYFVPFVIEEQLKGQEKKYFRDNKIHIICVGKFEIRKNQIMLLDVFNELSKKYEIELTLVGEVSTEHHKDYMAKIVNFIKDNKLEEKVKAFYNLHPDEVIALYKKADLFILPSTREMASVSQLEAMACGLPVICSDTNGTACYVQEGQNGYLFEDENKEDLKYKIDLILSDKSKIKMMGEKSLVLIKEKYSFNSYKRVIEQIVEKA